MSTRGRRSDFLRRIDKAVHWYVDDADNDHTVYRIAITFPCRCGREDCTGMKDVVAHFAPAPSVRGAHRMDS